MRGITKINISQESINEAIQEYLDKRFSKDMPKQKVFKVSK
jgi:hypothetical protein